jgi:hypothetical protein
LVAGLNSILDGSLFIGLSIILAATLLSVPVKAVKRSKIGKVIDVKLRFQTRDPWWVFAPTAGFLFGKLASAARSS